MEILCDTREKNAWAFEFYDAQTTISSLPTADYTLKGFEDKICIERKATSGEVANNLRNKDRLIREFIRMSEFDEAYLICEFSIDCLMKFPACSGIPPKFWYKKNKHGKKIRNVKFSGKYILNFLEKQCKAHSIELIFCENRLEAEEKAYQALRDYEIRFKK